MPAVTQPLIPKSGQTLQVIALGRISTLHQDAENIEASYRYIQDYLGRIYDGPLAIKFLGEQASGMRTDRRSILDAEELVASGTIDLVIAEDLSRIWRNPRYQFAFVQNAVDVGTRVICIGDNLDTAEENWEITMGAVALRHGLHIPDTRRRVRRTATHSFHKGGMVLKIRYGYRKLTIEEASSGMFGQPNLRVAKCSECTPVIREMVERVGRGESFAVIADWLNAQGIQPGPYVTSGRWTARLVVDLLTDPILAGTRTFRDTVCRPIYKTGRHKAEKNAQPETECCPQLAHLSAEEHNQALTVIAERRRQRTAVTTGPPKRRGVPRSRSLWPGQSIVCGSCGGLLYYAGDHLRCANALRRRGEQCWNRVQVPVGLTRKRVLTQLETWLGTDANLRQSFAEATWLIWERTSGRARQQTDQARERATLERQATNLTSAIAAGGELQPLVERLQAIEAKLAELRGREKSTPQAVSDDAFNSIGDVVARLPEAMRQLVGTSFEFADLLRRVMPEFVILPVQALDTPLVRPRARFWFCREAIRPTTGAAIRTSDQPIVTIDLFEPPLHIRCLEAYRQARLAHPNLSQRKLAGLLGLNAMTVKRAVDYLRRMETAGESDPYRELSARPASASRWTSPARRRRRSAL